MKSLLDYRTEEELTNAHNQAQIENDCALTDAILEICPSLRDKRLYAVCSDTRMEVFRYSKEDPTKQNFGTEVKIYRKEDWDSYQVEYELNFGTCGSYNPMDAEAPANFTGAVAMAFTENWKAVLHAYEFHRGQMAYINKKFERAYKSFTKKAEA